MNHTQRQQLFKLAQTVNDGVNALDILKSEFKDQFHLNEDGRVMCLPFPAFTTFDGDPVSYDAAEDKVRIADRSYDPEKLYRTLVHRLVDSGVIGDPHDLGVVTVGRKDGILFRPNFSAEFVLDWDSATRIIDELKSLGYNVGE